MQLRFFFDPGSGTCLWAGDDEARAAFGYAIELERLPLSSDTLASGEKLLAIFDTSIDWSNPGGPSRWASNDQISFGNKSNEFLALLRSELGSAFEILNEVRG